MNLCLVGEGTRVGMEPITSKQRLYLLYILEAAVRRLGVLGWGEEMSKDGSPKLPIGLYS